MDLIEFSSEFDILFNNIMSNQAPGLSEYEKSKFLTDAELEIVKNYFNPKGNKYQEGFDGNPKRQIDFSMILNTFTASPAELSEKMDTRSRSFTFPSDAMMVVNETCMETTGTKTKRYVVTPITYDEYSRLMSKAYKYPLKSQVWRILEGNYSNGTTLVSELIANFSTGSSIEYKIRYVRRPKPIILVDLDDSYSNVSIDGVTSQTECELDPEIHREILQRAVELAKAAFDSSDLQASMTMGQRSE